MMNRKLMVPGIAMLFMVVLAVCVALVNSAALT